MAGAAAGQSIGADRSGIILEHGRTPRRCRRTILGRSGTGKLVPHNMLWGTSPGMQQSGPVGWVGTRDGGQKYPN